MDSKSFNAISRAVAVTAIWLAVAVSSIAGNVVLLVALFGVAATLFVTLFMRD